MDQGTLSRDDFEGAPASLDEIETDLWLGNASAARNVATLSATGITHILTADSGPLPEAVQRLDWLTIKHVRLTDVAKEDILSTLDECIAFIRDALGGGHKVLVHCFFGVSRSAAVVTAFLMRKYQLSYEQALERVRAKRPAAEPNSGFAQQLMLFHQMHWCIDAQHQLYKSFRLRLAAIKIQKYTAEPGDYAHLVRDDPTAATQSAALTYRCRKCRRPLATDAQHFQHVAHSTVANPSSAYDEHNGLLADILAATSAGRTGRTGLPCSESIFVEPMAWMANVTQERQGKLHCPKCETKVGSFDWVEGCLCPCGALVAPAFYLVPSKVELSRRLVGGR